MSNFVTYLTTVIAIWAVLALSLNLQFGLTGLLNFGQVLFFAVGAYSAAVVHLHGGPVWLGCIAAVAAASLAGVVIALPVRRLPQDYWALVSLGGAEIFRLVMLNAPQIAGGSEGAFVTPVGSLPIGMAFSLGLLVLAWVAAETVSRTPFGRFLRVIREDELLAATLGRDVFSFQARVMVIAGGLGGAAGALYAAVTGFVSPDAFLVTDTFIIWTAVILGGAGNNLGVVLGAAAVELMSASTRFIADSLALSYVIVANLRLMLIGFILIAMVLYRPQGILAERRRIRHVAS
jgi:branched-chain amino acid transport system permease protein